MKSFILSRVAGSKNITPAVQTPDTVDNEALHSDQTEKSPTREIYPASDDETPSGNLEGVKKVEAVAIVWSKNELYVAYACNLYPYVLSDFSSHSLVPVTGIVSQILGGVLKLPTAQLMNTWGRAEGLIGMTTCCTIGLILMAVCNNVQTYAAAQCFYWVGYNGMSFVLDVFIADTSNLKNRALAFAFATTPYIATTWAGPKAAESFYKNSSWQWAFGCFSILTPVITLPILWILYSNQRKASKLGVIQKSSSGRTLRESVRYYLVEFDVIGIILVCAGFVLFLLPFSLAGYQSDKWASVSIIVMLVLGVVLLVSFALYEKYFSPRSFIPFHLLADRTIIGACILAAILFVSFYLWDSYYVSYLQVVHGLSITNAGYVANIYSIGACFWAVVVAFFIKITGRFKWLALFFGAPLNLLGVGLMIHFRQTDQGIGYVVMCQIFISFAGGTLVICEEMAAMAVVKHDEVAAILAVLGLSAAVGGAIGSSMAGAIWTNTLLGALADLLPTADVGLAQKIYGSLEIQLEYPRGSLIRTAIVEAYAIAQKRMTIAATSVLVLAFACIVVWKDVQLKDIKNVKGRVL